MTAEKLNDKRRVLVVDDEQRHLKGISHLMDDGERYQVFTAGSGEEAFQIIKTQHLKKLPIDVVISDSHMPNVNGFQLYQKLTLLDQQPSFILTSAFATEASVKKARSEGIAAVIPKPLDKNKLSKALDEAMEFKNQKKILLVDDHKHLASSYSAALRSEGHFVYSATSGQKALKMINKFYYDVYYVDLNLPDIRGIELVRAIREMRPDAMVVSLSGEASEKELALLKDLDCFDHLEKPMSPRRLRHMTSIYIQKHAEFRRRVHAAAQSEKNKSIWDVIIAAFKEVIRILKHS